MAETLPDLNIPDTEFVSLNTLSGIPVGSHLIIQNKGSEPILLIESTTKPIDDSANGVILPIGNIESASIATVIKGSLEIWARSVNDPCPINVQEGN